MTDRQYGTQSHFHPLLQANAADRSQNISVESQNGSLFLHEYCMKHKPEYKIKWRDEINNIILYCGKTK